MWHGLITRAAAHYLSDTDGPGIAVIPIMNSMFLEFTNAIAVSKLRSYIL
jgi:hypothetical protein